MTTITFFVSLFVMSALVISKSIEQRAGKAHFVSEVFVKGDHKIHDFFDAVHFKYNRYKMISNIFFFEFLPSYAYEVLTKMKDYVSKKYYENGDGFRGRRVLRSNGSVSFFLDRLADDKTSTHGHKV